MLRGGAYGRKRKVSYPDLREKLLHRSAIITEDDQVEGSTAERVMQLEGKWEAPPDGADYSCGTDKCLPSALGCLRGFPEALLDVAVIAGGGPLSYWELMNGVDGLFFYTHEGYTG